jgi:hypothetical protein
MSNKPAEEDSEEVITDPKTNETFVIPSNVATTGMKDENGNPIPDRVLSVLISEYCNYPDSLGDFQKKGEMQSKTLDNGNVVETVVYEHPTEVYKQEDFKNTLESDKVSDEVKNKVRESIGKKKVQTIKKTILKENYPTVLELRKMAEKAKNPSS